MVVSKNQAMRPAEIELIDGLDAVNDVVSAFKDEVAAILTDVEGLKGSLSNVVSSIADINSRLAARPKIDYGSLGLAEIEAGASALETVTFESGKTAIPYVVASLTAEETEGAGEIGGYIVEVSATGFTMRVYNNGSSAVQPSVTWIAIGD